MHTYYVLVKYENTPGASFGRMYIQADNPFQAIQMARALYGPLLISEGAFPVN